MAARIHKGSAHTLTKANLPRTRRLFVLTGAGVSAESGIPIFQGMNWRGHSHYEIANIQTWHSNPQLAWEYHWELRAGARDVRPNPAHIALAGLETCGALSRFFLCTQNIDALHESAGSKVPVHIHGKLFESRCADDCGRAPFEDYSGYSSEGLPHCSCGALARPNVCWIGEKPFQLDRVYYELELCNIFIAIGTSGTVQPAASFVRMIKRRRRPASAIYVGLDEPTNGSWFDEIHLGQASSVLPKLLSHLF